VAGYSLPVLALGAAWLIGCAVGCAIVAMRTRRQPRAAQTSGWATLNGLFLVGLAPVVAAIGGYFAGRPYIWDGAGVLVVGLAMILVALVRSRWPTEPASSFREKSLVIQIGSIVIVYGYFGVHLWGAPLTPPAAIGALIGITASMIAINVVAHVAVAIYTGAAGIERTDERDREIDLRGTRHGYHVLAAAWFAVLLLVIAQAPFAWLFLVVLAAFALAEIVRYGSMLAAYRLGL
jgi:hypothetical protein